MVKSPIDIKRVIVEFEFTDKHLKAQDQARKFALEQIRPRMAELENGPMLAAEILRQLGNLNLLAALVPEEQGGAGLDQVSYALTLMEISRIWGSLGAVLLVHNSFFCAPLLAYADPEQRKYYLKPCLENGKWGCLALSEAEAGLDFTRFQTRAVRQEKAWLINGKKCPVSNAQGATFALTAAKSTDPSGPEEINLFIIHLDQIKGIKLGKLEQTLGFSAAGPAEMIFENALLPGNALLGRPGQGRQHLKELEQNAWVAVAALAVGIGQAILEEARSFTGAQTQSGKPLAASQAIQWKLADLATDLEAAELLTLRAAWLMDQVKPFEKEAAMAKQYALNMVLKASRDGIQILAGRGYLRKSPMARLIQDAEGCQLFNIYDETLTSIIAKNL